MICFLLSEVVRSLNLESFRSGFPLMTSFGAYFLNCVRLRHAGISFSFSVSLSPSIPIRLAFTFWIPSQMRWCFGAGGACHEFFFKLKKSFFLCRNKIFFWQKKWAFKRLLTSSEFSRSHFSTFCHRGVQRKQLDIFLICSSGICLYFFTILILVKFSNLLVLGFPYLTFDLNLIFLRETVIWCDRKTMENSSL